MMAKIHIPAARVHQGELVLYATALKVGDLISENFYNVETLDPADPDDKGYQRLLNIARAKRLADYIIKGQVRWSRLSEQFFRVDKWSLCRG
jgi:hypothetical protein